MPTIAMGSSAAAMIVAVAPWRGRSGQVVGQRRGARVVEDERGGQLEAGGGDQPVAQFDGRERVEAELLEGRPGSIASGEAWPRTAAAAARTRWSRNRSRSGATASRSANESAPAVRRPMRRAGRARSSGGPVLTAARPPGRAGPARPVAGHRRPRVEQRQALAGGAGRRRNGPADLGLVEVTGQAAALGPELPGQRGR